MALTNQERVGKAIEQLRDGLKPFVERELADVHGRSGHRLPTSVRNALLDAAIRCSTGSRSSSAR